MKPLNLKERNASLWRFVGMYALIVCLAGAMIYLTAAVVPGAGSTETEKILDKQKEFMADLDSLSALFADMDKATEQVVWSGLAEKIGSKLSIMETTYFNPENPQPIYQKMIDNHRQWAKDKEKIWVGQAEKKGLQEQVANLEKELADSKGGGGGAAPNPELKACEENLQKASTFAGNILNLLNSMKNTVGGIKMHKDVKKKLKEGMDKIGAQADKIQSL